MMAEIEWAVRYDDFGFAVAITRGGRDVLHVAPGTERNESGGGVATVLEALVQNEWLRAAIATPEVYAGVVSEVVERERDEAVVENKRLREQLAKLKGYQQHSDASFALAQELGLGEYSSESPAGFIRERLATTRADALEETAKILDDEDHYVPLRPYTQRCLERIRSLAKQPEPCEMCGGTKRVPKTTALEPCVGLTMTGRVPCPYCQQHTQQPPDDAIDRKGE